MIGIVIANLFVHFSFYMGTLVIEVDAFKYKQYVTVYWNRILKLLILLFL